uniref:Extradiol ring-cleavage dioxygenase class III enzyme subunit B domain-containing protein n=1 Tax=Arcella intermedia TaxID=1963864 RepID=A0A6B2LQA2_9EUKA
MHPVFYLSHGGGPCFFMEDSSYPISAFNKNSQVAKWYKDFEKNFVSRRPKSIIIISAHWEESSVHITSNPTPNLYYDYYGFPKHTYSLQYPAKCDVDLAKKLHSKFTSSGIPAVLDPKRDWDHGVFVPLLVMYVPAVQQHD